MDPAGFLQGRTRETTIYRDAQGRWFHDGQPLEHPNLVRSFERWLEQAEDGRYCLKNDINWAYITLEGPAHFVRSLRLDADGGVTLLLSNDRQERLNLASLRQDAEGALYCDVEGGLPARFDRLAVSQLEDHIGEDARGVYLELSAERCYPPVVEDPLVSPPAA